MTEMKVTQQPGESAEAFALRKSFKEFVEHVRDNDASNNPYEFAEREYGVPATAIAELIRYFAYGHEVSSTVLGGVFALGLYVAGAGKTATGASGK